MPPKPLTPEEKLSAISDLAIQNKDSSWRILEIRKVLDA